MNVSDAFNKRNISDVNVSDILFFFCDLNEFISGSDDTKRMCSRSAIHSFLEHYNG